jgi:hypothetical protein
MEVKSNATPKVNVMPIKINTGVCIIISGEVMDDMILFLLQS